VTFYHIDIGAYDVADGDDSKRYHLPENQVAPLDMLYSQRRLTKGEEVLAIYPETTSFYPAYIVQAPRRTAIGTIHRGSLRMALRSTLFSDLHSNRI
jgi:SGF29 tudor-like domain